MNIALTFLVLLSGGFVDSQTYIHPFTIENIGNGHLCPPESYIETAITSIYNNISEFLIVAAAGMPVTYNIPECGGSGWRRVAFLNMTDPNQTCPEGWHLYEQQTLRACGRQPINTASCESVQISSNGYIYTEVCGRIYGYPRITPDAGSIFHGPPLTAGNEINEPYIDGISITYGTPRQHIWSLYGAHHEYYCCDSDPQGHIESFTYFTGSNFFCDFAPSNEFSFDNFLWDGILPCSSSPTCCAPHSGPWFNTALASPSLSDIEVRVCGDESTSNEDTPVALIEIYVK